MSAIPAGRAAALLLATALSAAAPATQAQEPPDSLADPDTVPEVMELAEIVVVGTRRGGRTAIESYSPVHVVSGARVRAQGLRHTTVRTEEGTWKTRRGNGRKSWS